MFEKDALEEVKKLIEGNCHCNRPWCGLTNGNRMLCVACDDVMYAALPQLLAEVDRYQWQSIESAPNDGTPVLLCMPDARHEKDRILVGQSRPISNSPRMWTISGRFGFDVGTPTFWMPLPPPPVMHSRGSNASS